MDMTFTIGYEPHGTPGSWVRVWWPSGREELGGTLAVGLTVNDQELRIGGYLKNYP